MRDKRRVKGKGISKISAGRANIGGDMYENVTDGRRGCCFFLVIIVIIVVLLLLICSLPLVFGFIRWIGSREIMASSHGSLAEDPVRKRQRPHRPCHAGRRFRQT